MYNNDENISSIEIIVFIIESMIICFIAVLYAYLFINIPDQYFPYFTIITIICTPALFCILNFFIFKFIKNKIVNYIGRKNENLKMRTDHGH
jgi:hypothetical protein